jgi:hypothetical protein
MTHALAGLPPPTPPLDEAPDALDEDALDEDALDEDALDEDAFDEVVALVEAADEFAAPVDDAAPVEVVELVAPPAPWVPWPLAPVVEQAPDAHVNTMSATHPVPFVERAIVIVGPPSGESVPERAASTAPIRRSHRRACRTARAPGPRA